MSMTNQVFLCVAPDGSLEEWRHDPGFPEGGEPETYHPTVGVYDEVGLRYVDEGYHLFFEPPEFWGREVIDEWVEQ